MGFANREGFSGAHEQAKTVRAVMANPREWSFASASQDAVIEWSRL
jgi:hypothetical protein